MRTSSSRYMANADAHSRMERVRPGARKETMSQPIVRASAAKTPIAE